MPEPTLPHAGDPTAPSEPSGGSGLEAIRALLGSRPDPTPRYRLGERIGRGGVGDVFAAWDPRLRRTIALKSLRNAAPGEEAVARFLREAQVTGQLEHPNIVPVHDIGVEASGAVFYTMKQVQGRSLQQATRDGSLGRVARMRIFLQVCDAVAYAHHSGVVHRDLKPANIMLGAFGEVFVLDWGLAKRIGDGDGPDRPAAAEADLAPPGDLTMADVVMGTPTWMSPEQARGEPARPPMDQYALGAILYLLVTGNQPFEAGPRVLQDVRAGRFPRPRDVVRDVPRELEAVILRAMATDPRARYASVAELQEDVKAWLEGREVATYRYTLRDRVGRWGARHWRRIVMIGAVTGGFSVAAGLALVLAGGVWAWGVGQARDVAVAAERAATRQVAETGVALALVDLEAGRAEAASVKLENARAAWSGLGEADPPLLGIARGYFAWRDDPAPLAWTHERLAGDVALGGARVLATDAVGNAWWLDGVTGATLAHGRADGVARMLAPSAGSGVPLVGWTRDGADGRVAVWAELQADGALAERAVLPLPAAWEEGERVILSADGSRALVSADRVQVYAVPGGAPLGAGVDGIWVTGASADVRRVLGRRRTSGAFLRTPLDLGVWDTASGEQIWYQDIPGTGALSHDGGLLAILGGEPTTARLVSLDSGETRWEIPAGSVRKMVFLPDGTSIALVGPDGAQSLALADGARLGGVDLTLDAQASLTSGGDAVVVSHPGRLEVRPWRPERPVRALAVGPAGFSFRAVDLSPDGHLAAVAGGDGKIRVVDADGGAVLRQFASNPCAPDTACGSRDVAFDETGSRVAVADRDGRVRVWELADARLLWTGAPGLGIVSGVDWVGDRIVSTHEDGSVIDWDSATGAEKSRRRGDIRSAWAVTLHPDGRRALVTGRGGEDPQFEIWDLDRGERIGVADAHGPAYRSAVSPDGRWFAVGTAEDGVWVWDLDAAVLTGRRVGFVELNPLAIGWTPDGKGIVAGAYDGHILILDPAREAEVVSLPLHRLARSVQDLAVRADGRMISVGDDARAVAFDLHGAGDPPWRVAIGATPSPAELRAGARQAASWYDWERALALYDAAAAAGEAVSALERGRVLRELGRSAEISRSEVLAAGMAPETFEVWSAPR